MLKKFYILFIFVLVIVLYDDNYYIFVKMTRGGFFATKMLRIIQRIELKIENYSLKFRVRTMRRSPLYAGYKVYKIYTVKKREMSVFIWKHNITMRKDI